MARNNGELSTEVDVASTAVEKTILQLVAPTNQGLAVKGLEIAFRGTSVTQAPIVVQLARQTTAGTMTARTVKKKSLGGPALQATGQFNATAEPTKGDILWETTVHPQGTFSKNFRPDDEILVDGGGRLGLIVISANDIPCRGSLSFEE